MTAPPAQHSEVAGIAHFDALHRASRDPWGVHDRWYEQRKRQLLLAALPRERYRLGFEPGCSVGGNSRALAARCDVLVASDASAAAIDRAQAHLADLPTVRVAHWQFPQKWPESPCDLVVVAELAYYLQPEARDRFLAEAPQHLSNDGHLLMCHWRHRIADASIDGDSLHALARQRLEPTLLHVGGWCDADMRIDVWQYGGDASVAKARA